MSKNFIKPVELEYTPEQIALAQKLGSRNKTESMAAAEAIAAVAAQPLLEVIQQAPVFSNQYAKQQYGPGDMPVIALSPLFDTKAPGYFLVYSASAAGGLNTNQMTGANDLVVQVHNLSGGAKLDKKYVRSQRPRLNVISDALARLAQEVLVQDNLHATSVLMGAQAAAVIDGNTANTAASNYQVIRSATAGVFQMDDFNSLLTKYRRVVSSWVGGTPLGVNTDLTDLFGSPEWMGQLRSISYQPQNTRAGNAVTDGSNYASQSSIAAPEELRKVMFQSAGIPSLFGINLHQYNELGIGQIYNNLFSTYAGSTAYAGYGGGSATAFVPSTEQIVIGLNLDWQNLISLTQVDLGGSEWTLTADDQFPVRADAVGWFGSLSRGYASVDNRGFCSMIF